MNMEEGSVLSYTTVHAQTKVLHAGCLFILFRARQPREASNLNPGCFTFVSKGCAIFGLGIDIYLIFKFVKG